MDANNTKYHLIYGERDWLSLLLEQGSTDIWWDREHQSITLAPVVQQLSEHNQDNVLSESNRRGAAYDHYGNIYWINDQQNEIHYHPAATPLEMSNFWQVDLLKSHFQGTEKQSTEKQSTEKQSTEKQSTEKQSTGKQDTERQGTEKSGDFTPITGQPRIMPVLRGLTVTAHEYLVVGTLQPAGILVFDLHAGGPPSWLCWPRQISFQPIDMSCAPDGAVWILDKDINSDEARLWHLDKTFRILDCSGELVNLLTSFSHDFYTSSLGGNESIRSSSQQRFLSGLSLNVGSGSYVNNPIAVEALSPNSFLLLDTTTDNSTSIIHYYVNAEIVDSIVLDEHTVGSLLSEPMILAHDFAFVPTVNESPRITTGSLYIVALRGQQSYKFLLHATTTELQLLLQPSFLPMRSYSGKSLIASGQTAYYDFNNRWLPLTEQPRKNYKNDAVIDGIIKDGEEPDCVWHRIIIDACIPSGTSICIESRTANSSSMLNESQWQCEPSFHLRSEGAELPFHDAFDNNVNRDITGSWDVLLQHAVGRYIELRLILKGNKRSTPRIQSCRIYYPRFSYLQRYLPEVYQADDISASFLDRFLANIEGLYTGIEDKISHAESLFDTRTSPAEFLEWLAGWLGAFVDPAWDDNRQRLFIEHAALLFKWRGTLIGLQTLLQLSIDECPNEKIFEPLKQTTSISDVKNRNLQRTEQASSLIRIVERFNTRKPSGISLKSDSTLKSDGTLNSGIALNPDMALKQSRLHPESTNLELQHSATQWRPALGIGVIHKRYQTFLSKTYADDIALLNNAWNKSYLQFTNIMFPPTTPVQLKEQQDWVYFTEHFIGFTYTPVTNEDQWRYQEFLQRRYRQVTLLNTVHGLLGNFKIESFESIVLPQSFPENKNALTDWIEFVSLALPIAQQAHRFTVLLPTVLGELPSDLEQRKIRVEEIVQREKPAHTQFDVNYFWAMFQVGSARLGIDTTIGDGTRFVALVLGKNFLGQSFLSESHPWSVVNRSIVGRERLDSPLKWRA